MGDNVLWSRRRARSKLNGNTHQLAEHIVRNRDSCCVGDTVVQVEGILDLGRGNLFPQLVINQQLAYFMDGGLRFRRHG